MNTQQEISISFDTIKNCGSIEEVLRIEDKARRINTTENST